MSKRGRKRKLGESMNEVRQLEGAGFSVLRCSSVNEKKNECFSLCVATINDQVTTITLEFIL